MREYELMVILQPELDGPQVTAVLDSLKTKIGTFGEVTQCDVLGRRRLTYTVRKVTQGTFALVNFTVPPAAIEEIKRFLRVDLHEQCIRELLLIDEKRGKRPPAQPLPGEEDQDEPETADESDDDRLARAAAERAAAEAEVVAEPVAAEAAAPEAPEASEAPEA